MPAGNLSIECLVNNKVKISTRCWYPVHTEIKQNFIVVIIPLPEYRTEKIGAECYINSPAEFIYYETSLRQSNIVLSKIGTDVNVFINLKNTSDKPFRSFSGVKITPVYKEKSVNGSSFKSSKLQFIARKPILAFIEYNTAVNFKIFRYIF